jgi:prepilin-type N-terminal cleavage/methylation domain-containing protein
MTRRGSSLVEIMIVIAISGVILALITALVGGMLKTEAQARQASRQSSELSRLSLRFRADAHSAAAARVEHTPENAARLTLDLGQNRSIEFLAEEGRVDRIRKDGDAVVHRDSFVLAEAAGDIRVTIEFESNMPESAPHSAAIAVAYRAAVEPENAAAYQISRLEAEIGRDRRLRGDSAERQAAERQAAERQEAAP